MADKGTDPNEVLALADRTRQAAHKEIQTIRDDPRLTVEAKAQAVAAAMKRANDKMAVYRTEYQATVERRRQEVLGGLMGGLKWRPTGETRDLLEKAETYAEDKRRFATAVKRAQETGDNGLMDALTFAARGNQPLWEMLPDSHKARYEPLLDFERTWGERQGPTRRMGVRIALTGLTPDTAGGNGQGDTVNLIPRGMAG